MLITNLNIQAMDDHMMSATFRDQISNLSRSLKEFNPIKTSIKKSDELF